MSDTLLWTQKEAAAQLRVSVRWLRDSSCPRVTLPAATPNGRPLLRYDAAEVRRWAGLKDDREDAA